MPVVLPPPTTSGLGAALSLGGSYNGLNFGPGAAVHVGSLAGVDDLPPIRSLDVLKAGDHGAYQTQDFLGTRTVTMALEIFADTPANYRALVDSVVNATIVQTQELPLYLYGSTRLINCRSRRRSIPYDAEHLRRAGEAIVEFVATDPRIYDATLTTIAVPVAVAGSGFSFPMVFPLTFGTAGAGGTFTATNNGNFPTKPTVHITGPVDNPRLEHTDSGQVLTMAISLASGDYLDLDFNARTIILNGSASRRNALVGGSAWWDIVPGVNHLRYSANTVALGSVATVSYRSAWL